MSLYRKEIHFKRNSWGSSLMVQWLRLHTPNARGPGLMPGQGIWSHMCNSSSHMLQWRSEILHVATRTWRNRINIFLKEKRKETVENCATLKGKKKWMCHYWKISCAEPVTTYTCILTPVTPWSINFLVYLSTQTSHLIVRTFIILISASLAPM